MHRPTVVVLRVQGEANGGLLGPSLPGAHLPGTPDSGDPFLVAPLCDGRCCVLCTSCLLGLPLWSFGGDVSGRGCTSQCGWACSTLKLAVPLVPW